MPIISRIGTRSLKVRLVYGLLYTVLCLGAVTMIYPFLLMLAGSVKSEADAFLISPYPEFWFNDDVLFQKYAESKYNVLLDNCKNSWSRPVANWRRITRPDPVPDAHLQDFLAWRATDDARRVGFVGHTEGGRLLPQNARRYRQEMLRRYHDDIAAFCRDTGQMVSSWTAVFPPVELIGRYRNVGMPAGARAEYEQFKRRLSPADFMLLGDEGSFLWVFLVPKYTLDIAAYNRTHGTAFASYEDVPLPTTAPAEPQQREDWENFVRNEIFLGSLRLDERAAAPWRQFLAAKRYPGIDSFNHVYGTQYRSFDEVPFVAELDEHPEFRIDWENFVKDPAACPLAAIRVHGPTQHFREFLQARHGKIPDDIPALGRLTAAADLHDCLANSRALRWEFTTRNYKQVFDYLALHGNGLVNTLIYCVLAVITALLVNPLAAYALSRFRLPGTYKILLFCMATMAFPGEVTMIPGFILLKRFPLWPIIAGTAAAIGVFLLLERAASRISEKWRSLLALAAGVVVGAVLVPWLAPAHATTSLLNTFAALILPGMANGFFIFLLKGFFDSMPKELYEAADLDGASEWTKFWMLTMNLSKPILAVIALGAFTGAYSAFMMALIIIPDAKMWTIMVWIYQLQTSSHQAVVYASLVIAALPTFLIFALCQNVILRGIVVPAEK